MQNTNYLTAFYMSVTKGAEALKRRFSPVMMRPNMWGDPAEFRSRYGTGMPRYVHRDKTGFPQMFTIYMPAGMAMAGGIYTTPMAGSVTQR